MTRDEPLLHQRGIVKDLCEAVAANCPGALVNIISNPVNSTVPIAAEVFKKAGTYDPKKVFGVTTLRRRALQHLRGGGRRASTSTTSTSPSSAATRESPSFPSSLRPTPR